MAKRVRQPDGTYCYTENCQIHDRMPAVGRASLIADAHRATRKDTVAYVEGILGSHRKLYRTKKPLHDAAEQITDSLWNADQRTGNVIGNIARRALKGEEKGFNDEYDWEKMEALGGYIQEGIYRSHQIDLHSNVIIASTGEVGRVRSTMDEEFFGGRWGDPHSFVVEVTDEHGVSRTQQFKRSQLVKINRRLDESNLARENIAYAQPNDLLPADTVSQLLREEVADDTFNSQALRGVDASTRAAVQQEFRDLADLWEASYQHPTISKTNVISYLSRQVLVKHPNLGYDEVEDYYQGLRNVVAYLGGREQQVG